MIRSPTPLLNTKLKELPKNTTKRDLTCAPASGPVRRFLRALGLQVSPSTRQSRRTRFLLSATPTQAVCRSRCQRALRQPHAGYFPAMVRKSERNCASSRLTSG